MSKVEEILKAAEQELTKELGFTVKLSIASQKRKDFVLYARIWEVCFNFSIEEVKNNKERAASMIMVEMHRVYIVICKKTMEEIDTPTMMQVIGKDRTSFYNLSKTAEARIQTKDEYFMYLYNSIAERLKQKGYEGTEI